MKIFSQRFADLRREKGLTQADLAKALFTQRSTISGYESEGKEPSFSMLCSIARFFNVSVDYLVGLDDCRNNCDMVFINDSLQFKEHYRHLPAPMRRTVAQICDRFYLLLHRDMVNQNEARLVLYGELFAILQSSRAEIKKTVDGCGGGVTDPLLLSNLMSQQNALKGEVCSIIDKLMQADIDSAFASTKKKS